MRAVETLSRSLGLPGLYRLFSFTVRKQSMWQRFLEQYVKPVAGEKVLDIGCGPADVLEFLPNVNYTGYDLSSKYIDAAKKRYGGRGRFLCEDVGTASIQAERGTFDIALATGVIHHLTNQQAASLIELARTALRPGGRLVTFDGCFVPNQSKVAAWLLRHDRGKYVRTRPQYEGLASSGFASLESYLRNDLLRIPYTHLIMRCSN
jgi:SAM-dependent methyltransferase